MKTMQAKNKLYRDYCFLYFEAIITRTGHTIPTKRSLKEEQMY